MNKGNFITVFFVLILVILVSLLTVIYFTTSNSRLALKTEDGLQLGKNLSIPNQVAKENQYKYVTTKSLNPDNVIYVDPLSRFTMEIPKDWNITPPSKESNEFGVVQFYKKGEFKIEMSRLEKSFPEKTPKEVILNSNYNFNNSVQKELKNTSTEYRRIVQLYGDSRVGENGIASLIKAHEGYFLVMLYPSLSGHAEVYIDVFDQVLATLKFN